MRRLRPSTLPLLAILLATGPARAATTVTVWAFGADKDDAAKLSEALGKVAGVTQSAVGEVGADAAKLTVSLDKGDGTALAKAISETPTLPLKVEKSAPDRVQARMAPAPSARLPYAVKPFEDKSKDKKLGDEARLTTDAVKIVLQNASYLVEAATPEEAMLTFTGRVSGDDKSRLYEVRILRKGGGEIAYGKGKGEAGLTEALHQHLKTLPQRLADLEGAQFAKNASLLALARAMDRAKKATPLRLVKSEGEVDLTQAAQYGANPVATLWVESGAAIAGAVTHASLEGLSTIPKDGAPIDLKGAAAKLPVLAFLDGARVAKAAGSAVAPLKVDVTFKQGEVERVQSFVIPVRINAKP